MYLIAESFGPYLNGSLYNLIDNYFDLEFEYGDLSNPQLPIILIRVNLGNAMIMCKY
jgi:hypothetical protein